VKPNPDARVLPLFLYFIRFNELPFLIPKNGTGIKYINIFVKNKNFFRASDVLSEYTIKHYALLAILFLHASDKFGKFYLMLYKRFVAFLFLRSGQ